jgi:hypothetical protein
MTPEDVKKRVEAIRQSRDDDEGAHSMEDQLYVDVLIAIRDGTIVDATRCCEEALKTLDIEFARWCA